MESIIQDGKLSDEQKQGLFDAIAKDYTIVQNNMPAIGMFIDDDKKEVRLVGDE